MAMVAAAAEYHGLWLMATCVGSFTNSAHWYQ
jgi:hypothetical protein